MDSTTKFVAGVAVAAAAGGVIGYLAAKGGKVEQHSGHAHSAPAHHHAAVASDATRTKSSVVHIDAHAAGPHLHEYPADGVTSPSTAAAAVIGGNKRRASRPCAPGATCPVIVGVAGGSGSGKTSIAELIAARLHGGRVLSISSDNYYKTLPHDANPADYNFDHPSSIDFDLLADHLERLRSGQDVDVPHYDFATHSRTGETTHVVARATSVIILDGIFVLWADRVAAQCDLTIFCSEDLDVCLVRRLRRDIVERKRTVESVLTQYLRFVKAGFEEFVAPSMTKADLIIPRAKENKVAIDMLARDLQRRVDAHWAAVGTPSAGATPGSVVGAAGPSAGAGASATAASAHDAPATMVEIPTGAPCAEGEGKPLPSVFVAVEDM